MIARLWGLPGLVAMAVAAHAAAAAQEPPAAFRDRIVVMGERRPAPVGAAAIATVSGEEVLRIAADHPAEIVNRTPGTLVQRGSGQEHLTAIRSPVLTGGAGAGSFLYLQDGVPLRAAGFANVNGLIEAHTELAAAVEVARGPSGAVYGANAIHGAIDVRSPAPDRDATRLDASVDTIGRLKGALALSRDLGGGGVFAGVSLLDDPGFRADSGVDEQKALLRGRAGFGRVEIDADLSFVNLAQETAGFIQGEDAYKDPALRRSNPTPDAYRDLRAIRGASRIAVDLGDAVELAIVPYGRQTEMEFSMTFLPTAPIERNGHRSVGVQTAAYLGGEGARLSAVIGLDAEATWGRLSEIQTAPDLGTFPQGVHYDYRVAAQSASPFVRVRYALTPRLELGAAARLDWTRYDYDNRTDDGDFGRFLRPPDRVDRFTTVSPKADLTYTADDYAVYLRYARGARPPQTTDLYRLQIRQTTDPARPETIDAVEIGCRGLAFGRLRYDLAGYAMDKRNFFFRDADGFNVSDGRTRHVGAEAEVSLDLPAGFAVDGNAAYGRHTYRFDRPVGSPARPTEAIVSGADIDTAPRWLAGLRVRWASADGRLGAEAAWDRVGAYFTDAANDNAYPGHDLVDLRGRAALGRGVEAYVVLRNALNTFYATRADFAFGEARYFPGEGRVLTVGLRYSG